MISDKLDVAAVHQGFFIRLRTSKKCQNKMKLAIYQTVKIQVADTCVKKNRNIPS